MDIFRIILQIAILYLFYYIGVQIQEWFQLAIPGSMIGMLILLSFFYLKVMRPQWVEMGSAFLLKHMVLLFLPVTSGVIVYLDLFAGAGLFMVLAAFLSTLAVMAGSGFTAQFLARRREENG